MTEVPELGYNLMSIYYPQDHIPNDFTGDIVKIIYNDKDKVCLSVKMLLESRMPALVGLTSLSADYKLPLCPNILNFVNFL